MSYVQQVEQHHKQTFRGNVVMLAQQMTNPMLNAVTSFPATGEAVSLGDFLGKKKARRKSDRDRSNPDSVTPRTRRWLSRPEAIDNGGEYIDKETMWDAAMDPTSNLMKVNVAAVTRSYADIILGVEEIEDGVYQVADNGIMGSIQEGKTPGTRTGLPSGQISPVGITGLDLTKLIDAQTLLQKADFGLEDGEQLNCAISPDEIADLLKIANASSQNLNAFQIQQLQTGKPTGLMNIIWHVTNRIPKDASGNNLCPVWAKTNIGLAVWQEINGDVWNDPHALNLPYLYVSAVVDAGRMQDKGVVVITTKRS